MKLFALRDNTSNKVVPNLFFANKQDAKRERDTRNAAGGHYTVTVGPDHRRYKD